MKKKTLVIGASEKPSRYSYKAIERLQDAGHEIAALALKEGKIGKTEFITEKKHFDDIHTVTLYVGPHHQAEYYDYIEKIKPQRVIFNPGTENRPFQERLIDAGILVQEACTLVLLGTNQY